MNPKKYKRQHPDTILNKFLRPKSITFKCFRNSAEAQCMECLELVKNNLKLQSTSLSLHQELTNLYREYSADIKNKNVGEFLAFCNIVFLNSKNIDSDGSKLPTDYSRAIKAFKLSESSCSDRLKILFMKHDAQDLISSFNRMYEEILSQDEKKKLGAFYTPLEFCRESLRNLTKKDNSTIYDPFCGGGAWLCAFLLNRSTGLFDNDGLPVFGTDIDQNAVLLCRLNLSFLLPKRIKTLTDLANQIRCVNFLYPNEIESELINKFTNHASFIATNPPYGFPVDQQNNRFTSTLERVPDKEVYYYAVNRVMNSLPAERTASFLIPNTFMYNVGTKSFRSYLAEQFNVQIFDQNDQDMFRDAQVRTALLVLNREKKNVAKISYTAGISGKSKKISKDTFLSGQITNQISSTSFSKNTMLLQDAFDVSQGLIPYDKYRGHTEFQIKNRVFHSDKKVNSEFKPELKGRDVVPFGVNWSGSHFVKYGKWLAAPRDPKFFRLKRVLIREITDPRSGQIICAYSDREFYNTPSIINVIPKTITEKSESLLKTLSVILSSSKYSKYHLENSPKAKKGLFPKILINDVRNIPIPTNIHLLDYSSIYDQCAKMNENGRSLEDIIKFIDASIEEKPSTKKAA